MGTLNAGGSLRLHAATWADLGVWTGIGTPSPVYSFQQWTALRRGYWGYLASTGALAPYQPNDQTKEVLALVEAHADQINLREARGETVATSEVGTDSARTSGAMVEVLSETATPGEAGAGQLALFSALAEALGFTEAGSDQYAPVDPFSAFAGALPRPLQAGKYPMWSGSAYVYKTASEVLQTIEAASSPGPGQFWIQST